MEYKPMAGESISKTADEMCRLARLHDCDVKAKFNDIKLSASASTAPTEITTYYDAESDRRHKAWLASPEYAKRQAEMKRREEKRKRDYEKAIAQSPASMSFADKKAWNEAKAVNTDGYGGGIMDYADRWARIMEGRIAKGETVAECAEETSRIADIDGLTGFMYGCAVSILSITWKHGEDLRRWHNLKTQIQDEGKRANETGGVLNPALLNIGG